MESSLQCGQVPLKALPTREAQRFNNRPCSPSVCPMDLITGRVILQYTL